MEKPAVAGHTTSCPAASSTDERSQYVQRGDDRHHGMAETCKTISRRAVQTYGMPINLPAAVSFMAGHARTLDRRRLDLLLGSDDSDAVLAALDGYRNPDGG